MLQIKSLISTLNQATTNGVRDALLVHTDGTIVVTAKGESSKATEDSDRILLAAVVSNVWGSYGGKDLNVVVLELEQRRVAITGVTGLVLCLTSDVEVEVGSLRMKALELKRVLTPPLTQVFPEDQ